MALEELTSAVINPRFSLRPKNGDSLRLFWAVRQYGHTGMHRYLRQAAGHAHVKSPGNDGRCRQSQKMRIVYRYRSGQISRPA